MRRKKSKERETETARESESASESEREKVTTAEKSLFSLFTHLIWTVSLFYVERKNPT